MRSVAYRFRVEMRTRWWRWLALAVLVGVIAGSALALAAGARRTNSAHDRFLAAQRAYDVVVAECEPRDSDEVPADTSCYDELARLPPVASATTVDDVPAYVATADGRTLQPDPDPCYSGPGEVAVVGASPGFGTVVQRPRYIDGRPADPAATDEVVISYETARRLALGPGSELRIHPFIADGDCQGARGFAIPVRVVGVQLSPGEVEPPSGYYLQSVAVTPAFMNALDDIPSAHYLAVRLHPGASVEDLVAAAQQGGHDIQLAFDQADLAGAVERAIRPVTVSLAILAVIVALAGAGVIGQLFARHVWLESREDRGLAELGLRRAERFALGLMRAGVVAVPAAVVAALVAFVASPAAPIGIARRVEPDSGFALDAAAVGVGAFVTVAFVVAVSTVPAWRAATAAGRTTARETVPRRRTLADAAAHAGFPPTAVSGLRLALERGSAGRAVPVLSSFVGLTIAVAAVAGALTFATSLTNLRDTPRLIGWNWDVVFTHPEDPEDEPPATAVIAADNARARRMLETNPGVDDYVFGSFWPPFPPGWARVGADDLVVHDIMAFDGGARFGPSIVEGRKPSAPDEILFGPHTLDELHLHVGDEVDLTGMPWEAPHEERTARLRIVGTGIIPLTEQLGEGASMTLDGLARLTREPPGVWGAVFVRFTPGADPDSVSTSFREAFSGSRGATVQVFGAHETEDATEVAGILDVLVNLEQIDGVAELFAVLMGGMAAAVLAHLLVTSTRARSRDLAVLRALGFTRRQIVRTVSWQAAVYAVVAVVVGVPIGVVAGRAVWLPYANYIGVVPEAAAPLWPSTALAATFIVFALAVAWLPARRAARLQPARTLRSE